MEIHDSVSREVGERDPERHWGERALYPSWMLCVLDAACECDVYIEIDLTLFYIYMITNESRGLAIANTLMQIVICDTKLYE